MLTGEAANHAGSPWLISRWRRGGRGRSYGAGRAIAHRSFWPV